ncbi:MAG: hypothetical protein KJP11_10755 [Gammaproteobacteria bacterium]|nr:hypothetical protein [Gammaproteobacteria bacterium]
MKVFLGLLLIVNVAFAAFQWLLPYEQLFVETKKIPAAVELELLSEAKVEIVSEEKVVAEATAKEAEAKAEKPAQIRYEALVVEDSSDKRVCYTIGPFKDRERAVEISGRYSGKRADTELKSSLEKDYQGVMVYIAGHKTREDAIKTANGLARKGIRDHIIVNNPDNPYILSLGVFGLKKNADRHATRVKKLGFNAETEARYRERTIFWLYAEQSSETEYLLLLDDADYDTGINQIPTECLPT